MPRFFVAIHHPDNYDPSLESAEMMNEIHALNREMRNAGVWVSAFGLQDATLAKSVRTQSDGKVLVTDGPYLETKEHIGGFWILECPDTDHVLTWAGKAAVACRAPVEVRRFLDAPIG